MRGRFTASNFSLCFKESAAVVSVVDKEVASLPRFSDDVCCSSREPDLLCLLGGFGGIPKLDDSDIMIVILRSACKVIL